MTDAVPNAWLGLVKEHAGLIISAMLAFVVVFRLLAFADWNATTAQGIVQEAGTADVVVGGSIAALPSLLAAAFALPGVLLFYKRFLEGSFSPVLAGLTVAAVAYSFPIVSILLLATMLSFWVVGGLFGWLDRTIKDDGGETTSKRVAAISLASLIVSTVLLATSPWLPPESIQVKGQEPYTGYVLRAGDNGEWVILREEPRQVEFIRSGDLTERRLCQPTRPNWLTKRIAEFFDGSDQARYPRCK